MSKCLIVYVYSVCTCLTLTPCRLPRSLVGSPLRPGDDILEINGVPIVDQDQKEVLVHLHVLHMEVIGLLIHVVV